MFDSIIKSLRLIGVFFTNELYRIFKDGGVLLICIAAMIIYPVLYASVYKNDVLREIPIAVVDFDNTQTSRKANFMIDATFDLKTAIKTNNYQEAEQMFWDEKIFGIVVIPKNFEKDIFARKQANIKIYSDGSFFLLNKQTLLASLQSIGMLSGGIELKRLTASGQTIQKAKSQIRPVNAHFKSLYNPGDAYGAFVIPALLIIVIQQTLLIGIGVLGATRREKKELGLNNEIIHREKALYSLVLGKSLAFFLIYIPTTFFALYWVHRWFSYPDKSKLLEVSAVMVLYIFSLIFLGLSISNLFKRREHSIIFLVFLSPIVLFLSGISWPAELIPKPLYWVAHIFPSTRFIPGYLRLRLMGVGLQNIKTEIIILIAQTVIYYFTAVFSFKVSLHRIRKHSLLKETNTLNIKKT